MHRAAAEQLLAALALAAWAAAAKIDAAPTVPSTGYAAICAVAKNENRFVREWVEYHKCLGFSHIYIYDHGSTVRMSDNIKEHVDSGFVDYTYFEGHHKRFKSGYSSAWSRFKHTAQGYAYWQCIQRAGPLHTFVGFIDLDEFLVLGEGVSSVGALLKPYEGTGGLAIHWRLLGSSNHTRRPREEGGVVDSYTSCYPTNSNQHMQFKAFVATRHQPQMHSPHRPSFLKPLPPTPEQNAALPPHLQGNASSYYVSLVDEAFHRIKKGMTNKVRVSKAAVFHYVTKSWEDYEGKLKRGGGAGVTRKADYFHMVQRKANDTCKQVQETKRRLCRPR